jgi:hypothetical protein
MTARFCSCALMLAVSIVATAQPVKLPSFDERSIRLDASNMDDLTPAIAGLYTAIKPNRSLLLSDCDSASLWCGQPDFSFPNIFKKAAAAAKFAEGFSSSAAESALEAWRLSAHSHAGFPNQVNPDDGPLSAKDRFHLLAIVNRMDLARWNKDKERWSGAELRFVYGLLPAPGKAAENFTVILEFVLPPLTWTNFQTLGTNWKDLSGAKSDKFFKALTDAFTMSSYERAELVRLRMNREVGSAWHLSEWDFDRTLTITAGAPLSTAPLPIRSPFDTKCPQAPNTPPTWSCGKI